MDITIFLADNADIDSDNRSREFIFREWDGTRSNAEARMASAGDDGTITLSFTEDEHEVTADLLERVYAATNGMPNLIDADVTKRYYEHKVRSLSVGDIVHVPGKGLFAVANMGFTRMFLYLPSDAHDAIRVQAEMEALAVAATERDAARAAALRGEDAAQTREWDRAEDGREAYEADVRAEREAFIAEDRASQAADDARFYSEGA